MEVIRFDTIDSTNAEAKRRFRAQTAGFGTLLIADEQTAGRGRLGRSFYSPKGRGVYFSLIIKPSQAELVTVRAAVAVCRAVEEVCGKSCGIKWINDIYCGGKKVAGILAEGISEGNELKALVLGVGINLRGGDFPEIIKDRAGSLETDADGSVLAVKTAEIFLNIYDDGAGSGEKAPNRKLPFDDLSEKSTNTKKSNSDTTKESDNEAGGGRLSQEELTEYKNRQIILDKEIEVFKAPSGGSGVGLDEFGNKTTGIFAKALDIDEKGRLIVEYDGKTEALSSAEVSIKT